MNTSSSAQFYVNQAMQLMQQGRFTAALDIFHSLEKAGMKDPRLYRTMGVAYERLNLHDNACLYFERSLALNPGQPELYKSLGRLYSKNQQWEKAESWYKKAIELFPSTETHCDLGFFYVGRGGVCLDQAQGQFISTQNLFGDSERVQLGLAQVLAEKEQWQQQNTSLLKSVARYPTSTKLKRLLAWSNKQCGKYTDAINIYQQLIRDKNTTVDDEKRLALTFLEQGSITSALNQLKRAITRYPESRELHRLLASVRYELGQEDFLSSYCLTPIHKLPLPLALDYVDQCIDAEQYSKADAAIKQLSLSYHSHPLIINREAKLAYKIEDDEKCISLTSALLADTPDNVSVIELRVLAALSAGNYEQSRGDINRLLVLAPNDQFYWALQSIQWRVDGDQRYSWLCDYEKLVKRVPIAVPESYGQKDLFLDELIATLNALHTAKHHPLTQSLRQGTQTPGALLLRQEPVIQALATSLKNTCLQSLQSLKLTAEHPTCMKNLVDVDFSASWSVKLKSQGFHASHVHPKGWYSSAFYVQVPDIKDKQGWLHLGKPGVRVKTPLDAEKWIKPEPGVLALFPSFMWHGTEPFSNSDSRMTVAFDLLSTNKQ